MDEEEILYTMALTRISHFNFQTALELYRRMGSSREIFSHRGDIGDILPLCSQRLIEGLKDWSEPLRRAETEMAYNREHGIRMLCMNDADYPQRLKECADAPIILYYKGSADLNQGKVINIVGTRQCTQYGQDIIRRFIEELHRHCPQVLIISGLAYGVDIHAHRNALRCGYETVGILAHGLDNLYPSAHRDTANIMVHQGGLLTEFMTGTNADKQNFVRRNRIVAGMSDACILVESAAKGGGLITADIARSYDRDVFAFPGRVGDRYSEGCNDMIRDNVAALISNATDFIKAMAWEDDAKLRKARAEGIERSIFPQLSEEQRVIVELLNATDNLQINIISVKTGLPVQKVTALLFELELMGVVKPLAGGMYHLLK
jgi:DNA processing protein